LLDKPEAAVTVTGYCADPLGSSREGLLQLSRARAENVARALRYTGGVRNPILVVGGGAAPGGSAIRGGQFDEARAAQMRQVEITF
jgi:outer membrane protein OmpA-like peptidoglycan-associated protein